MFQLNRQQQSQQQNHQPNDRQREGNFTAPLLNEYKRKFVLKRLLQTICGGCLLKFDYKVPFYVYLSQILLYILPFIFGGIGILIADLVTTFDRTNVSLITAAIFCIYINFIKILLKIIVNKKSQKSFSRRRFTRI